MAACPELPQKLVIDGREVSPLQTFDAQILNRWQLFGRMMRTSQTLDKYVYEAILRIRG
jgi:hypothetical protein